VNQRLRAEIEVKEKRVKEAGRLADHVIYLMSPQDEDINTRLAKAYELLRRIQKLKSCELHSDGCEACRHWQKRGDIAEDMQHKHVSHWKEQFLVMREELRIAKERLIQTEANLDGALSANAGLQKQLIECEEKLSQSVRKGGRE
jgi:hypothetical protein